MEVGLKGGDQKHGLVGDYRQQEEEGWPGKGKACSSVREDLLLFRHRELGHGRLSVTTTVMHSCSIQSIIATIAATWKPQAPYDHDPKIS